MLQKRKTIKLSAAKYRQLCEYVYNRDGWCVFCGCTDSATPAHVIRRSTQRLDTPYNLVRACVDCHAKFDSYQLELPQEVVEMLKNEPEHLSNHSTKSNF